MASLQQFDDLEFVLEAEDGDMLIAGLETVKPRYYFNGLTNA